MRYSRRGRSSFLTHTILLLDSQAVFAALLPSRMATSPSPWSVYHSPPLIPAAFGSLARKISNSLGCLASVQVNLEHLNLILVPRCRQAHSLLNAPSCCGSSIPLDLSRLPTLCFPSLHFPFIAEASGVPGEMAVCQPVDIHLPDLATGKYEGLILAIEVATDRKSVV